MSNIDCVYVSGPELVKVFEPYLSINTLNKWVAGGNVKTRDGLRSFSDTAIALCAKLARENERLKAEKSTSEDLKEEIERARLRKLLLEGDLIEIEKDSKLEELIRRDAAIAEIDDAFAKVRSKLMTLPNRLALEISGMTEPTDIKSRLDEVVREALDELNHTLMSADEPDSEE